MCAVRQSSARPPPEHIHRQANLLLDEVRASKAAQELPVRSVDDGLFAVAALVDEMAMGLPDPRHVWANRPLQATRWMTNNAGVEFFERLVRVTQGPKSVLATYVVVLGLGFLGRFGLPGADRYALAQLRTNLAIQLGVDENRDWTGGVLRPSRKEAADAVARPRPWWQSLWVGRLLISTLLLGAVCVLATVLARNLQ